MSLCIRLADFCSVLHGIWIFFNLVEMTYGVPSPLSVNRDGSVRLPCAEMLWTAHTEALWRRAVRKSPPDPSQTIHQAVARLVGANSGSATPATYWSPFAKLVLMHAITTQISRASDERLSWRPQTDDSTDARSDASLSLDNVQGILNKCRSITAPSTVGFDGGMDRSDDFLFNAASILRVAYGRALPGIFAAHRCSLLRTAKHQLRAALREFVGLKQERNAMITRTVGLIFEGLCVPVRKGVLLVRKTAALSWSMEHAFVGWDTGMPPKEPLVCDVADNSSVLVVTKWVHVVEKARARDAPVAQDELELLDYITRFLGRAESQARVPVSIAAGIARFWAMFYDDTWVWAGKTCDSHAVLLLDRLS